jgi:hypothetical protein
MAIDILIPDSFATASGEAKEARVAQRLTIQIFTRVSAAASSLMNFEQ